MQEQSIYGSAVDSMEEPHRKQMIDAMNRYRLHLVSSEEFPLSGFLLDDLIKSADLRGDASVSFCHLSKEDKDKIRYSCNEILKYVGGSV